MYVETVPNRNSRPAVLLREGWREGGRVRKRTLANLTDWLAEKVQSLRRVLNGQRLVRPEEAFAIERSLPHGHVEVLLGMVRRLGLDRLTAPKRSPERGRVLAMVVERLLHYEQLNANGLPDRTWTNGRGTLRRNYRASSEPCEIDSPTNTSRPIRIAFGGSWMTSLRYGSRSSSMSNHEPRRTTDDG